MTNTYYNSLSGMLAASYGLQNTSNNISNMQSYGFKRSDVFYTSLGNGNHEDTGKGVRVSHTAINFSQGNYVESGSSTSMAIVGKGFFVIRLKNNELVYTRDGSFAFKNGVLTDSHTNGQVQGYNSSGHLVPVYEQGPKESPGKASRDIFIEGMFVPHAVAPKDPNLPQLPDDKKTCDNVIFSLDKIYDAQGKAHQVQFEMEQYVDSVTGASDTKWALVRATCDDAELFFDEFDTQYIEFSGDDAGAHEGYSQLKFLLNGKDITVHFGTYSDNKAVIYKKLNAQYEQTNITIYNNDGYSMGKQYDCSFDENGQVIYSYDNGQQIKSIHIGLARFDDMEHNLLPSHNNYFRAKAPHGIHYGRPNHDGFDVIQPQKLETSNVDSTTEFANIVVLQRMFQACSQIMDIDKQLIEELEGRS